MKTNLFRKFKRYIVGFIMVVIILSVGLSFCTWDDLSIQALNAKANTGGYSVVKLNEHLTIVDDKDNNSKADVGDIVNFGRYYQHAGAAGDQGLTPQRWIIVDIVNSVATLLAEKVVVYGNFWGLDKEREYTYYQNYYQSTLRAWLNSGRDSVTINDNGWELGALGTENLRDDTIANGIGSAFNGDISNAYQANRGFLDVAFSDSERSILVPKNISGMEGYVKNTPNSEIEQYKTRNGNAGISDLVWVPSYKEIYGDIQYFGNKVLDGEPSEQFQYFKNANFIPGVNYNMIPSAIAEATDYAYGNESYNIIASYYNNGIGGRNGSKDIIDGNGTWWWLRSPYPSYYTYSLFVYTGGYGLGATAHYTYGGVRPAVCVQL